MIIKTGKRVLAALLGAALCAGSFGWSGTLKNQPVIVLAETNRPATVNATSLNVRSAPGTNNSIIKRLDYGTAVTVIGESRASDGVLWYKIWFTSGGQNMEGYVSSDYIKFPATYSHDADFEAYLNEQGFPDSYKDSLRVLHAENPSWIFRAQRTGLDWNEVINHEAAVGANLVSKNAISSWKSVEPGAFDWGNNSWPGFDGATWVAASREIVSYYMDPRNFLNDIYVFQFLHHSYDANLQTKAGLESMVAGTFLGSTSVNTGGGTNAGGSTDTGDGTSTGGNTNTGGTNAGQGNGNGPSGPGYPAGPGYEAAPDDSQSHQKPEPQAPVESQPSESNQEGTPVPYPSGSGNQGDVSLEGPPVSVGERSVPTVAMPVAGYGPGMDSSSGSGDLGEPSENSAASSGRNYVDIIMDAAAQSGTNPYVIAAMILQEQGTGKSGSISGTVSGYEGIYNFFNIGAYATGSMSAVTRGLWYASQSGSYGRPWNSVERSIIGGAMYYGDNYVKVGQDTFYLKKFNVQGSNLYKHQYMTNIEGAADEGAKLSAAYTAQMKKEQLVFKIPIYNNMPAEPCAKPTGTGNPNNKLSNIDVSGYSLTPTFHMDTESYDIIVNPSVGQIEINARTIDSKAKVAGGGIIDLRSGINTIKLEVTAENGSVRTYTLNVVRQADAPVANVPAGGNGEGKDGSKPTNGTGTGAGPGHTGGPGSGTVTDVSVRMPEAAEETAAPATEGDASDVQVGVGPGGSSNP